MTITLTQFIAGQPSETQGVLQTFHSPWDQQPLSEWSSADEMDVIRCLQSSKKFLGLPVGWPKQERLAVLKRLKACIEKNLETWSTQEALYQGLPQPFVKESGFLHSLYLVEKNIEALEGAKTGHFLNSPTGVIAIITAWSLSFRLVMESLIPAWAAGNSVIIKVSSKSPITAEILKNLMTEIQPPVGAVHILLGEGAKVGAFLAAHPGVRAVSFVGKTKTAEAVIRATAWQFKKLKIRGSAKNAAIVLPGFDSDELWDRLLGSFMVGQGQMGWSMSRLLTTESEAPKITERLKEKILKIKSSPSFKESRPWGPETNQNIKSDLVGVALAEQAKLLLPETEGPQFFLDLPNCSTLQQDELEAPVFPIVTVKYLHELAKWANNSSFGNLAVLWGNPETAQKLAEKLEFGGLWLNHWMRPQDESPWGLKQSAFGISENQAEGPFFSDRKLTV